MSSRPSAPIPGCSEDIPAWCRINGHELVSAVKREGELLVTVTCGRMSTHHGHHHHSALDVHEQRTERGRETRKVALVSGVVNLLLSLAQIIVGLLANSAALVADGIHSASDLLSDVLVWFAARHAAMAPDEDHPYGHGRFETAATLGLGILLILVALGIVWNGLERLFDADRATPGQACADRRRRGYRGQGIALLVHHLRSPNVCGRKCCGPTPGIIVPMPSRRWSC